MDGEAVSILQLVKGPIGVVSVCGPAQQGKSYISNQLLERTSGFQVALSGPGRCTKGLWLWSTPIRQIAADGTEYNILVMDTEGIDGCHHAEEYFLLALVLSSMLIYNEVGSLRPEFKKGMEELRSFVCEKTSPKKIGATVMTGPIFVRITRKILDAFNQRKLPMLASLLEDVGKSKRPTALKSATNATVVGTPPSANTRQRKRSIEQTMSSQEPAFIPI